MKRSTKSFELVQIKALGPGDGEPEGTFEALVAVFGNVDKIGDRINSKAFDSTLEDWRSKSEERGVRVPVIFAHNWEDPMKYIGSADPHEMKAIPGRGLYVKGQIQHMDTNPVAKQVYNLMASGVISEFSFGYNIPPGGQKKASDGATDLNEINLFEFGPCLRGVNDSTELLGVKSAIQAVESQKSYVDVAVEGSFEEAQEKVRDALNEAYAATPDSPLAEYRYVNLVATTGTTVTYQVCGGEDDDLMYQSEYTINDEGVAELGEPVEMQATIVPKAEPQPDEEEKQMKAEEAFDLAHRLHPDGVPADVTKAIFADPEQWIADNTEPEMSKEDIDAAVKAWDGAASNYTDAEYAKACILDRAIGDESFSDTSAKERYGLPIAKPGSSYSSNPDSEGMAAAAGRIGQAKASEEAVRTAAKRLVRAYNKKGMEVPEGVSNLAKADELVYAKGEWRGEDSIERIQADNSKSKADLELLMYQQSIDATEDSVGPMSADALEAAQLDSDLTEKLLAEYAD